METGKIFEQIMVQMDSAYNFMHEYDSLLHRYGNYTLYQAESHFIQYVGRNPGITSCVVASHLEKTKSACSQMIKRLVHKGWIQKIKNANNNREYKLYLTVEGEKIFRDHEEFDQKCFAHKYKRLQQFTEAELVTYLEVQKVINETFEEDVEMSRDYFVK